MTPTDLPFVRIKTDHSEPTTYMWLNSLEHFAAYTYHMLQVSKEAETSLLQEIELYGRSRANHATHTIPEVYALMMNSLTLSKTTGLPPEIQVYSLCAHKLAGVADHLEQLHPVLVNEKGGYQTFREDLHTIVEENVEGWSFDPKDYVKWSSETGYTEVLNLENAMEVEPTVERALTLSHGWCVVTNLRAFTQAQLDKVIRDFSDQGGELLYVYSTFGDKDQARRYLRLAAKYELALCLHRSVDTPASLRAKVALEQFYTDLGGSLYRDTLVDPAKGRFIDI